MTAKIESISDHRHPAFSAALRLYRRVFPEEERSERSHFVEVLREKRLGLLEPFNHHFLVALEGSRVVGLATGSYLAGVNLGFVGYLAAAPEKTRSRIGSRLRARLVRELRRDARAAGKGDLDGMLGEVEADNPWLRQLVRRGSLPLDFDYRQPPLGRRRRAVPLVLSYQPIGRRVLSLSTRRLRAILYAVYRRVYRVRFPLRQPAFRRMLKQIEGRRRVGRRAVARGAPRP